MIVKEQIGKTYYYKNFISLEEQQNIREWALRNESYFIPNPKGPFRARALFTEIPETLDILSDIKSRLINSENLSEIATESVRGDFISIQRDRAKVQEHMDMSPPGSSYYIRRYNIFISLPEKGGLPIYGGEVLNIDERSMLKVDAGLISHSTTQIEGKIPRILLSYGFNILK